MIEAYRKPYIDSDVFIGWIRREIVEGVNREAIASHIIGQATAGSFLLHTSTWTLAEVHKVRGKDALTSEQDDSILDFFESDFIRPINVDRRAGEYANQLCRRYNLKPSDAVHLACALIAECDVLLTWDRDFKGVGPDIIHVERPRIVGQATFGLQFTP